MMLETHRIKLVAKLKAIFDRFDTNQDGLITGTQVEQLLLYMNRPIDSVQVSRWVNGLKEADRSIEFPEFVGQYSALFAGDDPGVFSSLNVISILLYFSFVDVPVGETGKTGAKPAASEEGGAGGTSGNNLRSSREQWVTDDEERRDDRRRDDDDLYTSRYAVDGGSGGTHAAELNEKDVLDLKVVSRAP